MCPRNSKKAFLAGVRGILGVEVARARFHKMGEARQASLTLIRPHRFFPPPNSHLLAGLKVRIPGVVEVTIKVKGIVVHGDLRETIRDGSGRP